MSRKTRKLMWSVPLIAAVAVIGALAAFMTLTPNGAAAQELLPDPGQPLNLTATKDGQNTIDLLWEAPEGGAEPDGYRIDMSKDGLIWMQLEADTGTAATNYTHDGLDAGTKMYYRVFGLNRDAVGKVSNYAHATTDPAVAPDQPTDLLAVVDDDTATAPTTIRLCWAEPDEDGGESITGWDIETSMDGGQRYPWADLDLDVVAVTATNATETQCTDGTHTHAATHDKLLADQRWVYQVKAVNKAGTSEPSLTNDATTATAPAPAAPTGLIASVAYNSNEVRLHWYAPDDPAGADIDGYLIEGVDGSSFTNTDPIDDTTLLELTDSSNFLDTAATGADHGQERTYRVWAVSSTGQRTAVGTPLTITIPVASTQETPAARDSVPDMPKNLKANAQGRTSIALTWERPDNMGTNTLAYRVDVSDNDGLTWSLLNAVAPTADEDLSYTHTGLLAGQTRYYRVFAAATAFGTDGEHTGLVSKASGPHPAKSSATTARAVKPDEPSNLKATESGQTVINLCWTQPFPTEDTGDTNLVKTNAGHKVEASMDGGVTDPWEVLDIEISDKEADLTKAGCDTDGTNTATDVQRHTHTATHKDLEPGTRWVYQVKAVNSAGDSSPSLTDDATTEAATVPSIPVGATGEERSATMIVLLWNTPLDPGGADITGYKVEISDDEGETWTTEVEDTMSTTTHYDDTGLTPDTTYTYRVSAINMIGTGQPSEPDEETTPDAMVPGAPTGASATADSDMAITVSWTAPADPDGAPVTGNIIERAYGDVMFLDHADAMGDAFTNAQTWWDGLGCEAMVLAVMDDRTADANNPFCKMYAGLTEADKMTVDDYFMKRYAVVGDVTSYEDTGLMEDTEYSYRVKAVNAKGAGEWSNTASATTDMSVTVPSIVLNVAATATSDTEIMVTWDPPANDGGSPITGYTVIYRVDGAADSTNMEMAATGTSATISGLMADTTYRVWVRATNAIGDGSSRGQTTVTTQMAPIELTAPSNVRTNPVGSGIVLVSWDSVAGAAGYSLIATNLTDPSAPTRTAAADADAVSGQIQNLTTGDEYLIFVGAFNDDLEFELSEYVKITAE